MDGELVTDLPSNEQQTEDSRYGDKFEELCSYYMSIGMSYYDYWDGDNCIAKYYRKIDKYNKDRKNYELWLQGAYFYEAILDASPTLNSFSKKNTPFPYRSSPFPITEDEIKSKIEEENNKRIENGNQAMQIMMENFNKRFSNINKNNVDKENINKESIDQENVVSEGVNNGN